MRLVAGRLLATLALLALPACSAPSGGSTPSPEGPTRPATAAPTGSSTAAPTGSSTAVPTRSPSGSSTGPTPSETAPTLPEPTTTNTLPPPPAPTRAAPSTAGDLGAGSLPVPAGWRPVARKGGQEEGYLGNGTWVHARDPRYAAFDVITIGCAPVTRDDYRDPQSALEGTYDRKGEPGIGLVLEFGNAGDAASYFRLYRSQAAACRGTDAPVRIRIQRSASGLVDRRTYPDGDWIEVGNVVGRRVTLIILSDPGHRIGARQTAALLASIR